MTKPQKTAAEKARKAAAEQKKTTKAGRKEPKRPEAEKPPVIKRVDNDLPQKPTDALARIVGPGPLSLRQANQLVWMYVQRNGFQDREQPHMVRIKAVHDKEEPLRVIVGAEPISMFELTEKLRKHLR